MRKKLTRKRLLKEIPGISNEFLESILYLENSRDYDIVDISINNLKNYYKEKNKNKNRKKENDNQRTKKSNSKST